MTQVLSFEHVSKKFVRYYDRPQSFMESFISRWRTRQARPHDDFWVVRDLSFTLSSGQALGIIGDNGSGKSTILKLAAAIVEPTSGQVKLDGRVGALLEVGVGFHPDLTGRENVYLSGAIIGLNRLEMSRRFDGIVAFSGVEPFIDMPVRHYSSGMLVRLGFSVATSVDPDILLVDEVLAVGDYAFHHSCLDRIAQLQANGTAILFVSHNLEEVRSVCDRVIWLHEANVELSGASDEVVRAYINYNLRSRGLEVVELGDAQRRGRQMGSGEVSIIDCVLLDERREPIYAATNGLPLVLRVGYDVLQPVRQVVLGVSIYTEDGVRVVNADSGAYPNPEVGSGFYAYLTFPNCPLQPGRYEMTVAAHDPDSEEYRPYSHHHRAYELRVGAGFDKQEAVVRVPYQWDLGPKVVEPQW
jgi:lipopolysaccharide transport system ATP-binding protein